MRNKIKNAVDELTVSSEHQQKSVKFSHEHPFLKGKSVKGEVTLKDDYIIQIALTEIKGYNPQYIKKSANLFLRDALRVPLGVGTIVWTKQKGTQIAKNRFILPENSKYFGVGEFPRLDCNGWFFMSNVEAQLLGEIDGYCKPGSKITFFRFIILTL